MTGFDFREARRVVFGCALPANTKMLLLVLIEHMPNCYPSVPLIAQEAGISPRQVKREVKRLERRRVLVVQRRTGKQSTYNLTDGWVSLLPVPESDRCHPVTGATQSPVPDGRATGATTAPPPVPSSHPKQEVKQEGKQEDLARPQAARQSRPSFALNPTNENSERSTKPKRRPHQSNHPEHAQIREHYVAEFKRLRGVEPSWGAAQGKAVNELIAKLKGDVPECHSRITNGLEGWNKATILSIAGDPDKCVVANAPKFESRKSVERQQGDNPDLVVNGSKWASKGPAPVMNLPIVGASRHG